MKVIQSDAEHEGVRSGDLFTVSGCTYIGLRLEHGYIWLANHQEYHSEDDWNDSIRPKRPLRLPAGAQVTLVQQ